MLSGKVLSFRAFRVTIGCVTGLSGVAFGSKIALSSLFFDREAIRLRHGVGISGPCTISTKKYAPHLNTTLHLNVGLQIKLR